jgi:hypothetical protein
MGGEFSAEFSTENHFAVTPVRFHRSDWYWGDIVEHICNSTNFNSKPSLTNLGVLGVSCSSRAFLYPPPNNVAAQE